MAEVEYVAHVIVMPIVLSIGMVNQCLNVCTLASLPSGFLFLKASAVADILSIIAFIPFILRHAKLHDTHCYGCMLYHAHIELPLVNSLITASALCIVAMTVDRYLSVCHPIAFWKATDSKARSLATVILLYGIAFCVYLPSAWQKEVAVPRPLNGEPVNNGTWEIQPSIESKTDIFKSYLFVRELITRVGPVVILVVLNAAMIRSLRQLSHNSLRRSSQRRRSNARSGREADRTRISVLLFITSTTFIICNIPASLLSLAIYHVTNRKTVFWETFRAVANLLQVTSYLYNFYLYALCSSEYRNAFLKLFGCRENRSLPSTADSPTIKFSTTARHRSIKTGNHKAPLVTAEAIEQEEMTALQGRLPLENCTTTHI